MEKVAEGCIKVPERFLGGTLGDLIHPGKFGLLKAIQFAMQGHCGWCVSRRCIFFDFSLKTPVVREAGTAGVFAAQGSLVIIQF
jgi:hypothetical protein